MDAEFKFNVNLQHLSMIKVAINLWSNTDIKKKINDRFGDRENIISANWRPIFQQVIRNLHSLNIPKKLHRELEDVVIFIGEKVRNWTNWLVSRLGLDISFAEKIYWTDQGTVNESKIFRLYWEKDINIKNMKKCNKLPGPPLFYLAAIFGEEVFFNDNKKEIVKETNRLLSPHFKISEDEHIVNLMYIWAALCIDKTVKSGNNSYAVSAVNSLPEHSYHITAMVQPLLTYGYCGYYKFLYYFWYAMTYNGSQSSYALVNKFKIDFLSKFRYFQCVCTFNYEREKLSETFLSLAPHYSEEFNRFLRRNRTIFLKNILTAWPLQEFFVDLFHRAEFNEREREDVVFFINRRMKSKGNGGVMDFSKKNIYNVLLRCIEDPPGPETLMEEFLSSG